MSEPNEVTKLRARVEVLRAQRDSAIRSLEEERAEFEDRTRLLTEEQDRFVSRLIDTHEQEVGRLSGELQEACYARDRFRKKLERARREAMAAEESTLDARCLIDRLRTQIEHASSANQKLTSDRNALAVRVKRLSSELEMARTLLGLAMDVGENQSTVPPDLPSDPPQRASGVVGPRKVVPSAEDLGGLLVDLGPTGTSRGHSRG